MNERKVIFRLNVILNSYLKKSFKCIEMNIPQVDYKPSREKKMNKLFIMLDSCVYPVQMQSSPMKFG